MRSTTHIISSAVYLPAGRIGAQEIADASALPLWVVRDKLGIHSKVTPGPEDHPVQMGVWAAQAALAEAGITPEELDVVISIVEEHKEYPVWTAGIKLAHDLGAHKAYAYDLGQKCGTGILALKQASDMLIADETIHTVLVAGGYRNGDLINYRNARVRFMYNLAAGGAAAVVQRVSNPLDARGYTILGSAIITDGRLSLDVLVPVGGTKVPLSPDNTAAYQLDVTDPEGMKMRLECSLQNFTAVIQQALARSGYQTTDIDFLALLHMKRSAHDALLDALGLPPDKSIYLADYGHVGQVDPFLSLQLAQEQGKVRSGSLVVLAAAGVGYVWNAICLRCTEKSPSHANICHPHTLNTPS